MTPFTSILRAQFRSLRNMYRYDVRMSITSGIILCLGLLMSVWSAYALLHNLSLWQAADANILARRLWSIFLALWSGFSILSIFAVLRMGFASDEATLLFTLPLPCATRFRMLFLLTLLRGTGLWLLFLSVACIIGLGWHALSWLALGITGTLVSILCTLLATLFVIRYILPLNTILRNILLCIALSIGGLLCAFFIGLHPTSSLMLPSPIIISGIFLLCLLALVGPFASACGTLYEQAFYTLQGLTGPRSTKKRPGGIYPRIITTLLAPYRTVTGAMLFKEIRYQTRNPLNWLRALSVLIYLLLFPWIYRYIASYHIPTTLALVAYLALLVLISLIDAAPSPIGSEGNRLILYLTAPLTFRAILHAKLLIHLVPLLAEGLLFGLAVSYWQHIDLPLTFSLVTQLLLIITGTTSFLVLASVWDEDLSVAVEGSTQILLHEQLPSTPRRLWLITLTLLLLAGMLLSIWRLPFFWSLGILIAVDSTLIVGGELFGSFYLRQLLKG